MHTLYMVSKLYVCLYVSVRGSEHKVDSDLARSISQFCEDIPVGVDELFKVQPFLLPQNYFPSSPSLGA